MMGKFNGKAITHTCQKRSNKRPLLRCQIRQDEYAFCFILNTEFPLNQATATKYILRSFLALYTKLDNDDTKADSLNKWNDSDEKIVILKGYDRKHLKYLYNEARFLTLDMHLLWRTWGQHRVLMVLSLFGQGEDLEEIVTNLSLL